MIFSLKCKLNLKSIGDLINHDLLANCSPTTPVIATNNQEEAADLSGGSIASGSSGFGSLPKKRPALFGSGTKTQLIIAHVVIFLGLILLAVKMLS